MPELKMTRSFLSSLSARVLYAVLAVTALALLASYYFMTQTVVNDSLELLLKQEQQGVERLAKRVDQKLQEREAFLELLALKLQKEQGELMSPTQLQDQLSLPASLVDYFSGYVVVDAEGLIVSDYPRLESRRGSNIADRDYLIATREERKTQRSQALMGRFSQVPMFILSTPIQHQGELVGFLIGYQQLDQEPIFQKMRQEFQGFSSELLILDQVNRLYIAAPDDELLFQPLSAASQGSLVGLLQEGQMQGSFQATTGDTWLYAASEIPGVQWLLVRKHLKEPLLKPIEALLDRYLVTLLTGLLVVSLLLLVLLNWLLAPVYRASRHLKQAADSHLPQQYLPEEGPEDIRSFLRAVNELQRLRAEQENIKEDMISVISHELRTPLTSIKGALSLLNAGGYREAISDEKRLLEMADRNADRLLLLVNDLLDMASLSKGQLQLNMQEVQLQPLIDQVVLEFSPYATKKGYYSGSSATQRGAKS